MQDSSGLLAHAVGTGPDPSPARSLRVLFLSASLQSGGAERQLVALARGLRAGGHEVAVAVLYGGGPFEAALRAEGIPIHDLGRRGRWDLRFWPRLARRVRRERPDAVLAYLGGPNTYAALLKLVAPEVKVVFGIRSAARDLRAYDWLARIGPRIEALASALADAVVANSEAARAHAEAQGVAPHRLLVIPNGIDCAEFRPDAEGRARLRRAWGIEDGSALVGMVARLDPVKNHPLFLEAAARVAAQAGRDVRFVVVGGGAPSYQARLARKAAALGIAPRLVFAGERPATREVYGALDVAVLTSDSESFPNVVAEAMACGTPVVATDVGDTAFLLGDTGRIVPPRDPAALAGAILELLAARGAAAAAARARARARIEQEFSLERLAARTEHALRALLAGTPPGRS